MPNLIAAPIFGFLISSTAIATTLAGPLATFLGYAAFAGGLYLANTLLAPDKPSVPKPSDGAYNLKQNVPPRTYVLGTVKKGGDYAFLEERYGVAHHVMVWACHRIQGFVTHYAHDEALVLDGSGNVTNKFTQTPGDSPTQYLVRLRTRLGLDNETAYGELVSEFASIWSNACRGDGLATVYMRCETALQEYFLDIYPNQMPEHSAVGNGALLYDPRKDSTQGGSGSHRYSNPNTWEFSRNIALMRLWHLCHPVGGKMTYADMHLPEWMHAANVCDQLVVNRSGGTEPRYHGGMWFRANNDPVEVGRTLDEAGELVVYERADGKIGVHAGAYVAPDIMLDAANLFSVRVDKNRRRASTVLAVRGRYVNTANAYNTEDAAIYGDPYGAIDDATERTKTFDNSAVQSHNHCQRKQKLTFIRSNARRVTIVANYAAETVRNLPYRRFVAVNYPSRGLVNTVIEITSAPTIDLRNMQISFSGIVVTPSLYDFNAAVEEGAPGAIAPVLEDAGVPVPSGFSVSIQTEVVTGGATAAFAVATWTPGASSLSYALEFDRVSGSTGAQTVISAAEASQVRTPYLADGVQYKFRLRAFGGGRPSDWTDYQTLTATADPSPPGAVTAASATGGAGQANFSWTAPNSANYAAARLYINTANTFSGSTLVATEYGPPNISDGRVVTGLTAGLKYGFVVAINASGVAASPVATGSFTVT
ncbi:putative tail fiber protein H [Nostoc phage Nsp-JY10]